MRDPDVTPAKFRLPPGWKCSGMDAHVKAEPCELSRRILLRLAEADKARKKPVRDRVLGCLLLAMLACLPACQPRVVTWAKHKPVCEAPNSETTGETLRHLVTMAATAIEPRAMLVPAAALVSTSTIKALGRGEWEFVQVPIPRGSAVTVEWAAGQPAKVTVSPQERPTK